MKSDLHSGISLADHVAKLACKFIRNVLMVLLVRELELMYNQLVLLYRLVLQPTTSESSTFVVCSILLQHRLAASSSSRLP